MLSGPLPKYRDHCSIPTGLRLPFPCAAARYAAAVESAKLNVERGVSPLRPSYFVLLTCGGKPPRHRVCQKNGLPSGAAEAPPDHGNSMPQTAREEQGKIENDSSRKPRLRIPSALRAFNWLRGALPQKETGAHGCRFARTSMGNEADGRGKQKRRPGGRRICV